jgi:glycosyltransferase involved in cell wall biosynthesis
MRVVALVKSLEHVCCRYRVAAFAPYLDRAGHVLEILHWPNSLIGRVLLRHQLRGADVVILQRKMPPAWQLTMIRSLARRLVYDVDDAVFVRDSFHPLGQHCPKRAQRFRGVVQAADAVVAGNQFLHEQAALWTGPDKVRTVPTCIDTDRYRTADHTRNTTAPHLVWIGSASTLRGLEQIRPLLERVGHSLPGLRLKVICDRFIDLRDWHIACVPWKASTEADELAQAQIGFSWLPDDLWSQGKCGLKVLQYMAAGLPVIANPVGIHRRLISHGRTGFLVETPADCVAAIRSLTGDPLLRQRMGRAARELAAEFHVARGADLWCDLLDRLGSSVPRGAPVV